MEGLRHLRRRRDDCGAAALEFALLVPLLLVLIGGMVEFGLMYQAKLAVTAAARESARLAAVADGSGWNAAYVEDAAYPLRTPRLLISSPTNLGEYVSVTVSYRWTWKVLPLGVLHLGAPPLLEGRATMRRESAP